ncbi:MAG: cystathionine gamma-synthase [Candidatus Obscuribacterales bacterium]|nr:cystathionine gamma-synthase [Candidatus Obscuribacterales bacterium]
MSQDLNRCKNQSEQPSSRYDIENVDELKFATRAVLVGQEPDPSTGAISVPIYQTSTFLLEELGVNKGYQYARSHNPTRTALEKCLASLENGKYALTFSSGLAAASAVLNLLSQGDHVIVGEDVYGGVYRLFEKVFTRYGITFTYVNAADVDAVGAAILPNTKLLWLESPTNPILKLADIRSLTRLARQYAIVSVVDNTFASPYFQRPLDLGADVVVHSTTKYLSGHSDVIGGAVVTSCDQLYETIKFHQNAVGAVPGPFDCFLTLRGIKTLPLRMREHERSALAVAEFLESHPAVERVYYPGLESHPQHELAKSQMKGFGGVVAFVLKGGEIHARTLLNSTRIFGLAESLGGTRSLICHPASMTHAPVPYEVKQERGITDGLIRLSIGLEDVDDLICDLEQSLEKNLQFEVNITEEKTCSFNGSSFTADLEHQSGRVDDLEPLLTEQLSALAV